MERALFFLKRFIPKPVFEFFRPAYHWCLAFLAAFFYHFPARRVKVVGVTGTSGKTTTSEMLFKIFQEAGFKVAALDGL
ncbi:MAG: Mur ligase family protein, partial [bacterium]|nr:Mur ligase family protein [bacterium]